jgi:ABC-type multidrug transport system fused ATPase/permease subunit
MKHFTRSLRYLWPYRGRLALSVGCVLIIAGLWGGGLGLVLPGAKILLSPEGLHGWAYTMLMEDHLGTRVIEQEAPAAASNGKVDLESVLSVASVSPDSPCSRADIATGNWIIGIGEATVRPRQLIRQLAQAEPGQEVVLRYYSLQQGAIRTVAVTIGEEKISSRILKNVARMLPEPADYAGRFPLFAALLVVVLVLTVARGVFTFIQEYLVGIAIWLGIMDLRCENYNVVLHLPMTFFSEKGVSDATSRFVQDTNELARGQHTLLGKTLVEPAKAVSALALALLCSWEMTVMVLVAGPPAFWIIRKLGRKMHKASRKALEGWSRMLAILNETLIGMRVVKAYTMECSERRRFFRVNREVIKQQVRKQRLETASGPLVESLGIVFGMGAAGVAGYLVFVGYTLGGQHQTMDRDVFLTWMVALFAMFDPVRKLAKVATKFHEADAAAQRLFELRDMPLEPHVPNAPMLPRHRRDIEFRNVSLRYPGASIEALKEVDLTVRAGQRVAIVGPNGSGKTTLVSLLPRLLDPSSGTVLIDGQDVSQVSVRSLRRQIGLVSQDTVIFHATVEENIAYGLRRPHREAVLEAGRKSFVDEFVRDMPNGYQTMVGEYGATLSGGQKQRIAIARAFLRDPAILIFDEALSQVDSDSEHRINLAMEEFVKGRTTLLIAHRFATVLSADMIVVMNSGRIVDTGTHKELLARCELYAHLYRTQFVDSGG